MVVLQGALERSGSLNVARGRLAPGSIVHGLATLVEPNHLDVVALRVAVHSLLVRVELGLAVFDVRPGRPVAARGSGTRSRRLGRTARRKLNPQTPHFHLRANAIPCGLICIGRRAVNDVLLDALLVVVLVVAAWAP
jgi:hypothetical protein